MTKCVLKIQVNSRIDTDQTIKFMFVHDKGRILLEDGSGISLPSPLTGSYNFTYMPYAKSVATIALNSPFYTMTLKATEGTDKTFVATGRSFVPLHIPKEKLQNVGSVLDIKLENVETDIAGQFNENISTVGLFDKGNYVELQAFSDYPELVPNIKSSYMVMEGICQNFRFSKKPKSTGLITVTSQVGREVAIYVKKGAGELASFLNHDLKSYTGMSEVLTVDASESTSLMDDEYSVAVCSSATSLVDILLNIDTSAPVISLSPGEILRKVIKKGSSYLVHFVTTKDDKLTVTADGEIGRVMVYKSSVDDALDFMELDKLMPKEDPQNLVLNTYNPGIPNSCSLPVESKAKIVHYLFRVVALDTDLITLYVLSSKIPVQIALRQDEKLQESLMAGESRKYILRSAELEKDLKLRVKMDYGQLMVSYTTPGADPRSDIISDIEKQKILSLSAVKESAGLIDSLINTATVTITAKKNSLFDIVFEKPQGFYKAINPGTRITVNNSKDTASPKYFYRIKDQKSIKAFKVFIMLDRRVNEPLQQMLAGSESNFKDLVMSHFKFQFIGSENFSSQQDNDDGAIVADIKNADFTDYGDRKLLVLDFTVQLGTFLIGYQNREDLQHLDISFELSLNSYRTMKANSFNLEYADVDKPSEFQIMVPESGDLYVDFEDCSGLLQVFGSTDIDETKGPIAKRKPLSDKVFSFVSPGLFYVSVEQRRKDPTFLSIPFLLRTQFISDKRQTLLASYFQAIGTKGAIAADKVTITSNQSQVAVSLNGQIAPPQSLATDYPDINFVCLTLYTTLAPKTTEKKTGDVKAAGCGWLDYQVLKSATILVKGNENMTYSQSESCVYRDADGKFDFSKLGNSIEAKVGYPSIMINSSNRQATVSLWISYFLGGPKLFDDYDDFEHVLGYSSDVVVPSNLTAETPWNETIPELPIIEEEINKEPKESGGRGLFILILILVLICLLVAIYLVRRLILSNRNGFAFAQATKKVFEENTTPETSQASGSRQMEISDHSQDI